MALYALTHMFQHKKRKTRFGARFFILLLSILIGASLCLWARFELSHLLSVHEGAHLSFEVRDVDGFCGTPSVYVQPFPHGDQSDYQLLIDMLGGANRYENFENMGRAKVIYSLPVKRRPGVGLGRGLPDGCHALSLRLRGDFKDFEAMAHAGQSASRPLIALEKGRDHQGFFYDVLYKKQTNLPSNTQSEARFLMKNVPDFWQFGYKRLSLDNKGLRGVNVFLYQEDHYLFLNAFFNLLRP